MFSYGFIRYQRLSRIQRIRHLQSCLPACNRLTDFPVNLTADRVGDGDGDCDDVAD